MSDILQVTQAQQISTLIIRHLQRLSNDYSGYGLLDYPSHHNIGDSAIWLGEITLLKKVHGKLADYVSHCRYPISEIGRFVNQDSVIYLHGGGNFGDIWPRFQSYREAVLQRYPNHRVIQLPQSLHYRRAEGIEITKRAIGRHQDFHLMVRDQYSLDLAKREFDCETILVPDSAFGISMTDIPRNQNPQGIIALLRADQERREDALAGSLLFRDVNIADWNRVNEFRRQFQKLSMGLLGAASQQTFMRLRERRFTAMAEERVRLGFVQLDAGSVVVTDRLHGHIMSTLLGKPHVVIDNFYGKIRRFIEAWGKDDITYIASTYEEARKRSDELLLQR
jgi:exopolysaccharide biosynthesis predicted pyruvyltransferase EpsI